MNLPDNNRPAENHRELRERAVRALSGAARGSERERTARDGTEEDERYANIPCTD